MCSLKICDVVVACKTYADATIYNQNHHRLKSFLLWFATDTNYTQFWSRSWVIPHRNVSSFAYIVPKIEEIVEIFEYILHFQIIFLTAVATSDTKSISVNAANVVWSLLANGNQSNCTEMKVNRQRSNHIITEEITHNYSNRLNRICFRLRECKGMRKKRRHTQLIEHTYELTGKPSTIPIMIYASVKIIRSGSEIIAQALCTYRTLRAVLYVQHVSLL